MRRSEIDSFLGTAGWGDAEMTPLAGDASRRRYFRLALPDTGERAVLMDAPPDSGEDVIPFLKIAHYLRSIGLSAPDILASLPDRGLLLIQDLGDALFARVLDSRPEMETKLYNAASDVLVHLHQSPPPAGLATYTPDLMTEQSLLIVDWYLHALSESVSEGCKTDFTNCLQRALTKHASDTDELIQRDYHSENLL